MIDHVPQVHVAIRRQVPRASCHVDVSEDEVLPAVFKDAFRLGEQSGGGFAIPAVP